MGDTENESSDLPERQPPRDEPGLHGRSSDLATDPQSPVRSNEIVLTTQESESSELLSASSNRHAAPITVVPFNLHGCFRHQLLLRRYGQSRTSDTDLHTKVDEYAHVGLR